MKIKVTFFIMLIAVSAVLVSCNTSQPAQEDQATQTDDALAATRTQVYLDYQASKPTATLTATITPTPEPLNQPRLKNIQMVSPEIGWALDSSLFYPSILRTEDGGETWFEVAQSDLIADDTAIHAIDENSVAYTLGVFNVFDGDRPWNIYDILDDFQGRRSYIDGIDWFILNENEIWLRVVIGLRAGGAKARFSTTDGGKTWKMFDFSYDSHEPDQALSLIMLNEYSGWANNWRPYTL